MRIASGSELSVDQVWNATIERLKPIVEGPEPVAVTEREFEQFEELQKQNAEAFSSAARAAIEVDELIAEKDAVAALKKCDKCGHELSAAAKKKAEITSDDVLTEIESLSHHPSTHNLAAIGSAMKRAWKMGVIGYTDRVKRSERLEKHGNRQNVWKSFYFQERNE